MLAALKPGDSLIGDNSPMQKVTFIGAHGRQSRRLSAI
jgi:hypothetical protein